MYLKRIAICGFKSFADKTVLDFEPGISGIIGPNGCGKSNISDSIRWCLGEQSVRSMRSSNMQEVIFGGTQTRATTGMAEVSLTFDNSQNVLPVDYSEVTVTRRLFRSGESEYFINKIQCRLKDVKDMFLDTGMGSDGYSIIEQGKVDFLTTAKPENRRELFEEAAGVAKYKVRREETLRRLDKIDLDMSRLSNTLAIHKQQITALDTAAKKTKQYRKYQEDLEKHEVAFLVKQIVYGSKETEKIKKDLLNKTEEFESSNTLMTDLDAEIQNARLALDEKNERYISANKRLSEIRSQITLADQIIQNSIQRETEIKTEQGKLSQELAISRDKIIQMENQLKSLDCGDGFFVSESKCLENVYREEEQKYNAIKSKFIDLESQDNTLRLKLSDFESDKEKWLNLKTKFMEKKIRLDADTDSLLKIIARLENDLLPLNQEVFDIEAELTAAVKSLESFEVEKEKINKTILDNEDKIKILEDNLSKYKEIFASNASRITTLQEFDQRDPVRVSIRAVLSLKDVAKGPISNLIAADSSKSELIASALGEKLNYLVCDTTEKAERAMKFLEDNDLSRLSFIVVDKIPDFKQRGAIGLPLGYTELIKSLKYSPEYEKAVRFICSDTFVYGNKIYGSVVVQGGGKTFFEKPVLIEEQIKKLKEECEKIEQNIASSYFEIEQINKMQINLRFEKEKSDFDAIKIKTQIEERQMQEQEKRKNIENIIYEIEKHKQDLEAKSTELASFSTKIEEAEAKLTKYKSEENKLYEELKIIEVNMLSVRKEEGLAASLMMEARSAWDKKVAELENMRKGQSYVLDNVSNIKRQIQYAESRIVENNEKFSKLLASKETETVKIQQLHKEQSQKESEIQVFLSDKQTLQNEMDVKAGKYRDLRVKSDAFNNEINAMRVELSNFEYQENDLKNKLVQIYGKDYNAIKKDFEGIEVNSEEIAKIKRKIESLGPVNFAAQEDYNDLEQRYNFLLEQQQDLLKAKDNLHEVISKINRSTLENLKKTFDIVRANFKELYRELFGGGEADLAFTDESNPLASGVDVYAQPPGKKLQNIFLCSGGEKALTAVALLFAFFMAKPSPFCILDEVDASLDDANVGRYNAIIKEFSSKTQFLIITHNKRTMEMVDILYGVTMEERGISKIISVKMNKQDV